MADLGYSTAVFSRVLPTQLTVNVIYIIQICLVSFGSANQLAGFCMMGKLTFYELGETMPCVIKMRDM